MALGIEYALGYMLRRLIADTPWYLLSCLPFWGTERTSKRTALFLVALVSALRAVAAFFIVAFLENGSAVDDYYSLFHALLSFAAFCAIFKTHPAKIFYALLLTHSVATAVNFLSDVVVRPFLPPGATVYNSYQNMLALLLLQALTMPFVYRFLKGLVARAFSELSSKTFLLFSVMPVLFFILYNMVIVLTGYISGAALIAFKLMTIGIGLVSYYINLKMVMDTAKYMRIEQELIAQNAALDRVNRMKNDLLSTMSHETRTPLAVLSGYAELIAMDMRGKGVDEQTAKDLDRITDETQRLAAIMDEMQKLSRERDADFEKSPVPVDELCKRAARLYAPILARKGTALTVDACDGLPPAYANPNEVTQVLFNLLSNARKHTEGGSVIIAVRREGGMVAVTVTDTGEGIPEEFLPRAFERGQTADPEGSGIGLAISREIVEDSGGEISITSEPGRGTTVRFTLPAGEGVAGDGE